MLDQGWHSGKGPGLFGQNARLDKEVLMLGLRGWCWMACCGLAALARAEPGPPPDCQPAAAQVLERLDRLRAQARRCGGRTLAAAGPLQWSEALQRSAQTYARELARRDLLSHQGEQSASLRERLRAAGYQLRSAGENLAAGPLDLDEALAHWLASPEHCENLMAPQFEEMGLACVTAPGRYGRFWVLHLGQGLPTR